MGTRLVFFAYTVETGGVGEHVVVSEVVYVDNISNAPRDLQCVNVFGKLI